MNDEMSLLAQYRFTALVQRISNCGKIKKKTVLTQVLNVLIYRLLRSE